MEYATQHSSARAASRKFGVSAQTVLNWLNKDDLAEIKRVGAPSKIDRYWLQKCVDNNPTIKYSELAEACYIDTGKKVSIGGLRLVMLELGYEKVWSRAKNTN